MSFRERQADPKPTDVPLPWGIRLLIAFLAVEALKRALGVVLGVSLLPPPVPRLGGDLGELAIHLLICTMLIAMLLLRMRAGRYWCATYFALCLVRNAWILAYLEPELWVGMDMLGRLGTFGASVVDTWLLAYLIGPRGAVLDR